MIKKNVNKEKKRITKRQAIQTKLKEYKVDENMRLIDFLLKTLTSKSRNNIKSLLTNHQVLVEGQPISQFDFEVVKGDIVYISPTRVKESKNQTKIKVIYEDDDFIAIDKPSGLLSVADDKEKMVTAYRLVSEYYSNLHPKERIFICHRIDKDTSGVLLFCKNFELKEALQKDWNLYIKDRGYIALVEGTFKDKEKAGKRTSWLLETKTNLMYSSSHKGDGLKATTNYKVIKENDEYSLLDVHIDTGRKNQIRVHMKDLGHQIVGDDKYHSEKDPIRRLGLHAYHLEFIHPYTKKIIKITSKVPKEFNNVFSKSSQTKNTTALTKKIKKY